MNVYIQKFVDYDVNKLRQYFDETFKAIGLGKKLEKVKKLLIKPNLLGAYIPEKAVTVHPAVLEALLIYRWRQSGRHCFFR